MTPTPATLPGLLRRGTGVLLPDGRKMTVHEVDGESAWGIVVNVLRYAACKDLADLVLDMEDATSRAHLAWWILDRAADPYFARMSNDELAATLEAIERAYRGHPMNDRHINILVNVARHLAGLESE